MGPLSASIRSKLSAVAYWHHLHGWRDPADNFLVRKALLGASNLALPMLTTKGIVTPSVLRAIVQAVDWSGWDWFDINLFRAIFILAFFAFFVCE